MPSTKNDKKIESLDNLFESFSEALHPTKEELKKELANAGIDPELVSKNGLNFIYRLQARIRIELAKKEMLEKVAVAKEAIKALVPKLSVNHKEQLAKLLFGEQAAVAVNFNKLNDLSDSDIIDMLDEVQLLEFLESIKK